MIFPQTKTQKQQMKFATEISTGNGILMNQRMFKQETEKQTISNFDVELENKKGFKAQKKTNNFENIDILNDSRYLFNELNPKKRINSKDLLDNQPMLGKMNIFKFANTENIESNLFEKSNVEELKRTNTWSSDRDIDSKWQVPQKFIEELIPEDNNSRTFLNPFTQTQSIKENDSLAYFLNKKSFVSGTGGLSYNNLSVLHPHYNKPFINILKEAHNISPNDVFSTLTREQDAKFFLPKKNSGSVQSGIHDPNNLRKYSVTNSFFPNLKVNKSQNSMTKSPHASPLLDYGKRSLESPLVSEKSKQANYYLIQPLYKKLNFRYFNVIKITIKVSRYQVQFKNEIVV